VVKGQRLTYTITATNTGGQAASRVRVKDRLPASVRFASASAKGCQSLTFTKAATALGGTVLCTTGHRAPGAAVTIRIVARPAQAGTLSDTATGTATNVTADSDDSATATVTVHRT
jgi:uncharacterized repeat protein (TIGR01451 family)